MRSLQISQTLEFVAKLTERITEAKKYAKATLILVVCFITLPVILFVLKNSKLRLFEPFDGVAKAIPLVEIVHNNSSKLLGRTGDDVTLANPDSFTDKQNNSSNSSIANTNNTPIYEQKESIDDVLATGFSKESCISRYQYFSYHKSKNAYKPSPYLIAKLRSYEELHTRCGPQSSSYNETIEQLSRSNLINESKTSTCKYLVWTPSNGLGNRMVSIVSAFLLSVLQNRVLLVQFEADMDGLFCEPFPNSTWLLPKNFPNRTNWNRLPNFEYRVNSGEKVFPPSFLHLNLQHGHGDHNLEHFHCNETLSFLDKIPALVLKSDQYFVPSLFMISSFKEELNKMFPRKDTIFHHLGHYLFNPSNEAWGLITRFYQAYLANADEKIGIQIRVFDQQNVQTQNIMSQILSCTQTKNILPAFDNTTQKGRNFSLENPTSKSKAVLVTSLYPEYAEHLRRIYWTRPTINGDVTGVYQPSHEEHQKFGDNMHNMMAWAEIYLLSLCDVIVTSPQSTFGYVAQSLGGLKPWIMVGLGGKRVRESPCKQDYSMEPCFHFPPQYDCKNKTNNFTNLYPHFKVCDDLYWGIKLVDSVKRLSQSKV